MMPDGYAYGSLALDPSDAARSLPDAAASPGPLAQAMTILRALADMARVSKRQQAEVGAALYRAGLETPVETLVAALQTLSAEALVSGIIPLDDGGIILSVTSAGMERATR